MDVEDIALAAAELVYLAAGKRKPFLVPDQPRYAPLRASGYEVVQVFQHPKSGFMALSMRSETAAVPVLYACAGTQFSNSDKHTFIKDLEASLGDASEQFSSPAARKMRELVATSLDEGGVLICGQSLGGRLTQGFAYAAANDRPDRLDWLIARTFNSIGGEPLTTAVFGATDPAVSSRIDLIDYTVRDDPFGRFHGGRHLGVKALMKPRVNRFGGGGQNIDSHFFEALADARAQAGSWDLAAMAGVQAPWGWHRSGLDWRDAQSRLINEEHWPARVGVA